MTVQPEGSAWYLAQLRPNCGPLAAQNLNRQGFPTFLPTEDVTRRLRGRFVSVPRPLFPGYIFVAFPAAEGHWRAINSTRGITRLVSFGRAPAPVPREIIDRLMLRCDASGKLLPPGLLQPGDGIRVTSGPFAGFVGTIEALAPDRRVWVLMQIMGSAANVAVSADQLQAM